MEAFDDVLKLLKPDSYGDFLEAEIEYGFWGGKKLFTSIEIDGDGPFPKPAQVRVLKHVWTQKKNLREALANILFKHYEKEIYGSVSECGRGEFFEELTPKLTAPDQIWSVLCDPSVRIGYVDEQAPAEQLPFRLAFSSCLWDEEHGFGVEMNGWKVKGYCGAAG